MKNRRDTGVFLRIYHRSGLKSRLDSYSRSIFSIPFQLAAEIGFSFPGSRTIPRGWNLVKISTNSNRSIDENFIFFLFFAYEEIILRDTSKGVRGMHQRFT